MSLLPLLAIPFHSFTANIQLNLSFYERKIGAVGVAGVSLVFISFIFSVHSLYASYLVGLL